MPYRFYFLLATLLTVPFAIRKVIWVDAAPYFKEYSDTSIYIFEIFVVGYIVTYILEHKILLKSIHRSVFHVEQLLLFFLLSVSTLLAAFFEHRYFGIFLLVKWYLYFLFGLFLYRDLNHIVPRGTKFKTLQCSTWNIFLFFIVFSLIIQSIIIIFQFIHQKSLGLYLIGEPILDPEIAGVSTIIVNGHEILRGYGTFLHPNITAFFFFVYCFSLFLLFIVPRGTIKLSKCSTWNNRFFVNLLKMFHVEQDNLFIYGHFVPRGTNISLFLLILLGFFLTFSKSLLIIVLATTMIIYFSTKCSTWNTSFYKKSLFLFHVEQLSRDFLGKIVPRGTIFLLTFLVAVIFYRAIAQIGFINQSILERKSQYLSIPYDSLALFLVGSGLGSYVELLVQKSPGLFSWQLQPIHNTYILAVFELGLLPLLGISLYLWKKWQQYRQYPQFSSLQKSILVISGGVMLLLLVDHYMWDIEQGQFLCILLITILTFSFTRHLPKSIK